MSESAPLLLVASSTLQRTPAFERAVALARASRSSLRILALDYMKILELLGLFNHELLVTLREGQLQAHRHWLEQEAEHERKLGLDCTVQVIWSDRVFEDIKACVETMQPAMIIKDVHQESALRSVFSTPLDWHLLRDCQRPVQFVIANQHPLPQKILAAVNLYRARDIDLHVNDEILNAATRLGRQTGASVHVLYSYDWPRIYASGFTMMGSMPIETGFQEALADAHEDAFALLCERYGVDPRHRHFMTGTPQPMIELFARQNHFDLLVIGTLPKRGRLRIMGGTARALLGQAPCSVLIVKADSLDVDN
jgi:universal stress protein E